MKIAIIRAYWLCVSLIALALAACSGDLLGRDVIEQARPDGQIAFDVVKIDDAVLTTLLAQPPSAFHERFKKYQPPPDLKIAVGDTVSVVIWESAADGLFGNSLTELSFPAGTTARLLTGQLPASAGAARQSQDLTASPDTVGLLFGGAAAQGSRSTPRSEVASGEAPAGQRQLREAGSLSAQGLDALLKSAVESGRPGTRIPDQQVASDGAISIPYAGRIAVADRTPTDVQQTIEKRLSQKALDPQALVMVRRSAANSVSVSGEDIGGARVPLSPGGNRLLQVIAAAGGADAPVHDTVVRLSRDGVTATLPLATLVADPDQDIFAEPGDVLTLVRRPQTFSVFGATGKNAAITFNSDRLSLTEALAKAGGLLDDRADPRAVFLFRHEPVSLVQAFGQPITTGAQDGLSPIVYRLDLREAKSYLLARRFPVQDKDIIFVANAETVPIYRFFQVLAQLTGPIQTGFLPCYYTKC